MASSTKSIFTFKYVDAAETIAMGVTLPLVCMGIVALRFYTRTRQSVQPGVDDWLILGGVICLIGMGACIIDGAARHAMGYPSPLPPKTATKAELLEFNPPSTELIGKLQFAFQILMVIGYGFIKTSIVFFYRRIFVTHKRTVFDIATTVMNVVLVLWSLTFILIIIFPCGTHLYANWGTPASQLNYCQAIGHTSEEGLTASDLILDVFLLVLPIPSIWALRMTVTRKLQVSFIMTLGLSAIAASIARLVLYVQLEKAAMAEQKVDENQVLTLSMYWSTLESGLAIIAACLPSLSSLFTAKSLQSVIHSVRSVLSLRSSQGSSNSTSRRDATTNPYADFERDLSSSSSAGFTKPPVKYDMQTFEIAKGGKKQGDSVSTQS